MGYTRVMHKDTNMWNRICNLMTRKHHILKVYSYMCYLVSCFTLYLILFSLIPVNSSYLVQLAFPQSYLIWILWRSRNIALSKVEKLNRRFYLII